MSRLEHATPPPAVAGLVALGMWSVAAFGPRLTAAAALRLWIAVVLAVTGAAFAVLGIRAFRASRTTVNPLKPELATALVTTGVYRITRNPMYVGMAFVLLAWAVYLGAVLPFAGVAVFVLYITRLQIQPEERVLRTLFGAEYEAYAARVRRWL
jgi:protein-S-isoprenylcysteine O-methyltransferase Ste14